MSLSEATQLLLQAALQGKGGEILVLDMGEPVRIIDLAHDMIRLSGADPNRIPIVFTGLRPGEKLFEELLTAEEATLPTPHPKLRIALSRAANFDVVGQMVAWCERDRPADDAEVRARLQDVDSRVHAAGRRAGAADPDRAGRRRGAGAVAAARAAPALDARHERRRAAQGAQCSPRGQRSGSQRGGRQRLALAAVEIRIERRVVVHLELAIDAPERAPFGGVARAACRGSARDRRAAASSRASFSRARRAVGVRRVGARGLGAHVEDLEREDRQPIDHRAGRLRVVPRVGRGRRRRRAARATPRRSSRSRRCGAGCSRRSRACSPRSRRPRRRAAARGPPRPTAGDCGGGSPRSTSRRRAAVGRRGRAAAVPLRAPRRGTRGSPSLATSVKSMSAHRRSLRGAVVRSARGASTAVASVGGPATRAGPGRGAPAAA